MINFTYLIIAVLLALTLVGVGNAMFKKYIINTNNWVFKTIALLLAGVYFTRLMSADIPLEEIFMLTGSGFQSEWQAFVSLTLTWFSYAAVIVAMLYPFFKIKTLNYLMAYFVLPVAILDLAFLQPYFMGIVGQSTSLEVRGVLLAIEIGLMIVLATQVLLSTKPFKFNKKKVATFFVAVFAMLLAAMPAYLLQGYLGGANPLHEAIDLSFYHRLLIYAGFIIPLTIWYALKDQEYKVRHFALLYLSLATMFTFTLNFKFDIAFDLGSWPLHLCNTAMFIVPLTLIFKTEKVFYFTFFINVLGAFLAMLMPNYGYQNLTETRLLTFWINHLLAFFMPLLIVALKIYPRPKIKQFNYSTIAFTVYFVLVLFLNAWLNKDFFFLNSDFIVDKLGLWAKNTKNFTWGFEFDGVQLVFYPLYQFLFYLVYVAAAFGMWFIYEQFYTFSDQLADISKRKKQMKKDKYLLMVSKGKNGGGKMKIEDIKEVKLELKKLTKKYGSSDVFAVKDADLVVNGGEIFGFLGPNGAGKSTIIKSIVGILPITDGSIEVCGYDVDKESVETKSLIGFVPDHYALYEKLTGREYINYIADLYEVSQKDRDERIARYLKAFELEHAFDNQMKTYSHGMKQKIAIMSALVHDPKLWILDEPLTGLDPTSIFQVKEAMKQHAERGNIVFFSSHIIDVVERVCDRIAIIKKGEIKTVTSLQDLEQK